jgi:methyltransferase (TIGR00027 family)
LSLNPVSDTAFYCCGARMQDALRERPVCGDRFAQRFMDDRGLRIFERFKNQHMPNVANVARCRIIDDALRARLARNKQLNIVTIGAGFDTRPYRIPGGQWFELDEPQIIQYKNEKLPVAESLNPLQRVEIRFDRESLAEKLGSLNLSGEVVVVIEGVFLYLEESTIRQTLRDVKVAFPQHDLLCDLMTLRFFRRFASKSSHKGIKEVGAVFAQLLERPEDLFKDMSYRQVSAVSTYQLAHDMGTLKDVVRLPRVISSLLLNVFMRDLHGYAVHEFSMK